MIHLLMLAGTIIVVSLLLGKAPFMFLFGTEWFVILLYQCFPLGMRESLYMWHPPHNYAIGLWSQTWLAGAMVASGVYLAIKVCNRPQWRWWFLTTLTVPWWIYFGIALTSFHMRFF